MSLGNMSKSERAATTLVTAAVAVGMAVGTDEGVRPTSDLLAGPVVAALNEETSSIALDLAFIVAELVGRCAAADGRSADDWWADYVSGVV